MTRRELALAAAVAGLAGCRGRNAVPKNTPPAGATVTPLFADVTKAAGIRWRHNPCRTGHKYLPETVGPGGGFIDYDNDGWLDIILINGAPLSGYHGPVPKLALYRNNRDGTFTDVTNAAGLGGIREYGFGLAVGDYDNDGWPDIYLTALDGNRLLHNDRGVFRDVTERAGVGVRAFSTGATWIDIDRDGLLDLFVGDYVDWTPETDLPCGEGKQRQYCPPYKYRGARPYLFRNLGNGRFEDVSAKAGVLGHSGKTLGLATFDFNGDGVPDIYVANDTEPDLLLVSDGKGAFIDQGLGAGIAFGSDGAATGSMGVDIATPFNDGRPCVAVGTFAGQELSLFELSTPAGANSLLFDNRKQETGLAEATRAMTTFGVAFADFDLDGWIDLMLLNGHIDDDPSLIVNGSRVPYRQAPQLFQNRRDGTFRDVAASAGLTTPLIGRALAVGDIDNDGRLDLLALENGGPARLYRNVTKTTGAWLGVELEGVKSPRDGTGAMVTLAGQGWTRTRCANSARGYLAANDRRVHFGVGDHVVETLTIRWPSGRTSELRLPTLNAYLKVREPS